MSDNTTLVIQPPLCRQCGKPEHGTLACEALSIVPAMTPPVVLRVPPEGVQAALASRYPTGRSVPVDAYEMRRLQDLLTAFLSAIQPRQERALEAAMRAAMWCAATHGHAPDVGRAREAFLAMWNADAGRENPNPRVGPPR